MGNRRISGSGARGRPGADPGARRPGAAWPGLALGAAAMLGAAALLGLPAPARAQDPAPASAVPAPASGPATLVADTVRLEAGNRLVAEGAVEIWQDGRHLSAGAVIYDGATGQLTLAGPIRLTEPGADGSVLVADAAALDAGLREGILTGARLVLARELQLAAQTVTRSEGRYTTLERTVASSCRICVAGETPLWEIRARRVTHDAQTRTILFEGAQFRAGGVPLAYIPRLSLPDPTVERRSGLLPPSLSSSSTLGFGLEIPYFQTLGESRDLTIAPYFGTKNARTLNLRYREAYRAGELAAQGALSRDEVREGETRGYLFADAGFDLPRDYRLGLELRLTSDDSYLVDYGITDEDRLWSGVTLERVRADRMVWGRIGNTHSVRDGESNATGPMGAADLASTRLYRIWGGEGRLDWQIHGHRRPSSLDREGRDVARTTLKADWARNWLWGPGMLATVEGALDADYYRISQDSAFEANVLRLAPTAALTLRWPLVRRSGTSSEVLEPVAQIVLSRDRLEAVPNEDSRLVEFDEGNLFSLSRYPGEDRREEGLRANLGASWTRADANGASYGITAGRVFRIDELGQFGDSSGLTGTASDWLVSAHLASPKGLTIANRALFDDTLSLSREELRLAYLSKARELGLGYLWIDADETESRARPISELMVDARYPVTGSWTATASTRYDATANRAARAAVGVEYANECLLFDLSLSRRFTTSSSVTPETRLGLSLELVGFGASGTGPARSCAR